VLAAGLKFLTTGFLYNFNANEDRITLTLLMAMAKAASSGGSLTFTKGKNTPAAIGIPKVLYPSAHTKRNRMGEGSPGMTGELLTVRGGRSGVNQLDGCGAHRRSWIERAAFLHVLVPCNVHAPGLRACATETNILDARPLAYTAPLGDSCRCISPHLVIAVGCAFGMESTQQLLDIRVASGRRAVAGLAERKVAFAARGLSHERL
jgi:hypothetical protein